MENFEKIFDNIANIMNFYYTHTDIKNDVVLNYLFKKILTDLYAIQKLLSNETDDRCLLQAFVISRSMIETSVNLMYLLFYEDERIQYREDSQLLLFKDNLVLINMVTQSNLKSMIIDKRFDFDALCKSIETDCFNNLTHNNRQKLLNVMKSDKFKITDQSLKLLNKFFRHDFKPLHSSIEHMFIKLKDKIKYDGFEHINLRTVFYQDYNATSQLVHGIFPMRQPQLYNLMRICCNISNNLGAAIRTTHKNCTLPINLQQLILESHLLLHPEDKIIQQ